MTPSSADPLTIDDYLASRYIAKPVRLLDCDYPVDSASAVIFTTAERARTGARSRSGWSPRPVRRSRYLSFECSTT